MKKSSLEYQAIIVNPNDNVATALAELKAGISVTLRSGDKEVTLTLADDVPYGHKFSLTTINVGANVIKYGETIGVATSLVRPAEYVHVHNVASARARGDLAGAAE